MKKIFIKNKELERKIKNKTCTNCGGRGGFGWGMPTRCETCKGKGYISK